MEITGKNYSKRRAGFTMLEVLIALVIMTIGLLGTMLLETKTIKGNAFSREMHAATILAEDLLERACSLPFNDTVIANGAHNNSELDIDRDGNPGDEPNPIDESGTNPGLYTRTWQVVDGNPVFNSKTITVTVTWLEKTVSHNVTMATIIYGD